MLFNGNSQYFYFGGIIVKIKKLLGSVLAVILTFMLIIPAVMLAGDAADYKFPPDYWTYRSAFLEAVEKGYKNDIIKYGELLLDSIKNAPMDFSGVVSTRAAVYKEFITIYQEREDYDKAASSLREYIKCAEYMGWDDAVKLSSHKLLSLDLNINIYAETKNTSVVPYYRQRVEPRNGIYAGRPYSQDNDLPLRDREGITSFYALFGRENYEDFDWFIRDFDDNTRVLHFAWNLYEENKGLKTVLSSSSDEHIINTLKYINSLKSPTMLRIFAEMNVWQDLADPKTYKEAYIKVAKLARQYAPNTALIFAPTSLSNWDVEITDYYPGDEYVDWVGVSLYTAKYFSANERKARKDSDEAYYFNGTYENPIIKLKELISLYGSKKPVIITEGAAAHSIKGTNEDLTQSSVKYINQIYRYASMVYPQIKAAIYFDVDVSTAKKYGYKLTQNEKSKNAYFNAINANPAVNTNLTPSDTAYVSVDKFAETTDNLKLSAYAVFPNDKQTKAEYYIDGKLHTTSNQIPYGANIDIKNISVGKHDVKVIIKNGNYSKTLNYTFTKTGDNFVTFDASKIPAETGTPKPASPPASPSTSAPKVGDKLGNVLNSDVKTYINGQRIPCYNINNKAVILIADLRNYGFDVVYSDKERTSTVARNPDKKFTPVQGIENNTAKAGTVAFSYVYTDIVAIVNGKKVESYNVQGNLAIFFESLGDYGTFSWDNATKSSKLTLY